MKIHCRHGGGIYQSIGDQFSAIQDAPKIAACDVLDAWYPPAPSVQEKVRAHLEWAMRTSPPVHAEGLVAKIAKARNLSIDQIVVGGGSSDIIFLLLPFLVTSRERVVIVQPAYGEYAHYLRNFTDCEIVPYNTEPFDFAVNIENLIGFVKETGATALILVNPCNPTGSSLDNKQMKSLLRDLSGVKIIVDETYIDYLGPGQSIENQVSEYPNLTIIKSMSKIYALSGMRVGYAVCSRVLASQVIPRIPPYSIGTLGQIAAIAALDEPEYYRQMMGETTIRSQYLQSFLKDIPGIRPLPSVFNSLLLDLEDHLFDAKAIEDRARECGILLRDISDQGNQTPGRYLRIAVTHYEDMDRIIHFFRNLK